MFALLLLENAVHSVLTLATGRTLTGSAVGGEPGPQMHTGPFVGQSHNLQYHCVYSDLTVGGCG